MNWYMARVGVLYGQQDLPPETPIDVMDMAIEMEWLCDFQLAQQDYQATENTPVCGYFLQVAWGELTPIWERR